MTPISGRTQRPRAVLAREDLMSASRILDSIDKTNRRQGSLPDFRAGDSVKVWAKIREGEKTRLQAFEGVCIRRTSKGARSTFTVRKISYGVGVERKIGRASCRERV